MGKSTLLLTVIILFLLITGFQIWACYRFNNSHFVYPLDDTYIHMSMGKNLAESGQWGITKYEFSSASSSILYTLLLALAFWIFGINEYMPLIINIFSALGILTLVWHITVKENFDLRTSLIIILLIIFFTPLPALTISGMEHTLQIFINIIFVYYSSVLIGSSTIKSRNIIMLLVISALTVMVRFEGLFLVLLVASLFFLKKRRIASILILFAGILPVIIFGIISISKGSYFVPNSLLVKGQTPVISLYGFIRYSLGWLDVLKTNPHLLILFLALIGCFIYHQKMKDSIWAKYSVMALVTGLCIIMQVTFAKTGWFFRYEAYLITLAILCFAWILNRVSQNHKIHSDYLWTYCAAFFFLIASLYPLIERGKDALFQTIPATHNIYEQQYQMSRFVKRFYKRSEVCLNDIGAVSFFSEIKLLDIYGLGSKEITALKLSGSLDKVHIYQIAKDKNIKIAIIYDEWFDGKIPDQWKKAGEWEIVNNVILGGNVVSFYATEQYDVNLLKRNLKAFSPSLPSGVIEHGDFLGSDN